MFVQACFFGLFVKNPKHIILKRLSSPIFSCITSPKENPHLLFFPFSCVCISPLRETSGISITQEGNEVSPMKHKVFALNFWCKFHGKKTPWFNSHFHEGTYKPFCLQQHGSLNLNSLFPTLVVTNQVLRFPSMKSASHLIIRKMFLTTSLRKCMFWATSSQVWDLRCSWKVLWRVLLRAFHGMIRIFEITCF